MVGLAPATRPPRRTTPRNTDTTRDRGLRSLPRGCCVAIETHGNPDEIPWPKQAADYFATSRGSSPRANCLHCTLDSQVGFTMLTRG